MNSTAQRGGEVAREGLRRWQPTRRITSAATRPEHIAGPIDAQTVAAMLKNGPKGALLVSAIAVGLLFIGWMAFYFLLFLPRGPIG